ncbi:MAG: hypothetical protein WBK46_08775 [Ruminococcus flavefaciens]
MLDFITINEQSSIRVDEEKIVYCAPYNISGTPHDADIKAHRTKLVLNMRRQNNIIFRFYCRYVVCCNRIG